MIVSPPVNEGVVITLATPFVSDTVPRFVVPSSKVTVPVGTTVPELVALTVAVIVTGWAKTGGVGDAVTTMLVVVLGFVTLMGVVTSGVLMPLPLTTKV